MTTKPRYSASEQTLKQRGVVWIPGYENRYAFNQNTGVLYYLAGHDYFHSKEPKSRIGSNEYSWECTVDGNKVTFTTSEIQRALANSQSKPNEIPVPPAVNTIRPGSFAVGRVNYDASKKRETIEIIETNITFENAKKMVEDKTVSELKKFVIVQVHTLASYKVSAELQPRNMLEK